MGWAEFMWLGGIWVWFLGGSACRRRPWTWIWGTPVLLGVTGWILGGTIDGYGCCRLWDFVGGGVGVSAGFILGHVLADESQA